MWGFDRGVRSGEWTRHESGVDARCPLPSYRTRATYDVRPRVRRPDVRIQGMFLDKIDLRSSFIKALPWNAGMGETKDPDGSDGDRGAAVITAGERRWGKSLESPLGRFARPGTR